jgi:hypothetical protein
MAQFLSYSGRFDRRPSKNVLVLPFWELFDRVIRKGGLASFDRPTTAPRSMVHGIESQLSARFQIVGAIDKEEPLRSGHPEL